MEEPYTPSEKENSAFFENRFQPEFSLKNLIIGIAVVVIVIFFIYLGVSQSIKSSSYKSMDLSTKNQNNSGVAGASTSSPYGPPEKPAGVVVSPTKSPTATSAPQPTVAPTSAATATPTSQPTATPTSSPTATPTPDDTPTPTATGTATPTPQD